MIIYFSTPIIKLKILYSPCALESNWNLRNDESEAILILVWVLSEPDLKNVIFICVILKNWTLIRLAAHRTFEITFLRLNENITTTSLFILIFYIICGVVKLLADCESIYFSLKIPSFLLIFLYVMCFRIHLLQDDLPYLNKANSNCFIQKDWRKFFSKSILVSFLQFLRVYMNYFSTYQCEHCTKLEWTVTQYIYRERSQSPLPDSCFLSML